jgi:hypothetical protein
MRAPAKTFEDLVVWEIRIRKEFEQKVAKTAKKKS